MSTIPRKFQKNKSARKRRNQKRRRHRRWQLKILEEQLHLQEKLDNETQSSSQPESFYEQRQLEILKKQLHLQEKLDKRAQSSLQLKALYEQKLLKILKKQLRLQENLYQQTYPFSQPKQKFHKEMQSHPQPNSLYEQQQQIYPVQIQRQVPVTTSTSTSTTERISPVQAQPQVPVTSTTTGNIVYYIPTTAGTPIYVSRDRPPDPPGFRQQEPPGFRPIELERQAAIGQNQWLEAFSDKKIRQAFVRKVYLILTVQLLFTFGIICLFIFEPHVKYFVLTNEVLLWVALGVYIVMVIALTCVEKLRRQFPLNLIMLTLITLSLSYIMGAISCLHNTNAVLMAIGICAIVCFAVTIFSFFTKLDLTNCGGIMCILLIVLLIFGIVAIIVRSHTMTMIYAGAGALVFMAFLAYDTQMLMGGKMHAINPEEYVFAALTLYIDIMYIFMYILMLFGGTGRTD